MTEIGLWVYPWDLLDGGIEPVVARLGDLGINSLSVTTLYHNGRFLLPKRQRSPSYPTAPGVSYAPLRPDLYEAGWMPEPDPAAIDADLFPRIRAAASSRGIQLRAWTIAFHDQPRPGDHVVDALGDIHPFALCPTSAENRRYLQALVGDLSSRGWYDAIDLESYGYHGYRHGSHHERDGLLLGNLELFLLSLCFCRACTAAAEGRNVDAGSVQASVEGFVRRRMQHDGPGEGASGLWQLTSYLVNHPDVYAYLRSALANTARVLSDVRDATAAPRLILGITAATFLQPSAAAWQEGLALTPDLWTLVDRLVLLAYFRDPKDVYDDLWFVLDSTGHHPERVVLGQSLMPAESPDLANVLAKVRLARDLGIDKISLYNYGFLTEERVRWLAAISKSFG
jgi:hypothetical protein